METAGSIYSSLQKHKHLRVVLVTALVGTFIIYFSEIQVTNSKFGQRNSTVDGADGDLQGVLRVLRFLEERGSMGDMDSCAGYQKLQILTAALANRIELSLKKSQDGSLAAGEKLGGCQRELARCQGGRKKETLATMLLQSLRNQKDFPQMQGKEGQGYSQGELAAVRTEKELLETQLKIAFQEKEGPLAQGLGRGGVEARQLVVENLALKERLREYGRASGTQEGEGDRKGVSDGWKVLKDENEGLKAKLKAMEAKVQGADGSGGGAEANVRGGREFEDENEKLKAKLRAMEEKLKAAEPGAGAAPGSDALEEENADLKGKIKELETKLKAAEQAAAAGAGAGGPHIDSRAASPGGGGFSGSPTEVGASKEELEAVRKKLEDADVLYQRALAEKRELTKAVADCAGNATAFGGLNPDVDKALEAAKRAIQECQAHEGVPAFQNGSKLYACEATDEELQRYLDYKPREMCPDDWFVVQKLVFVKNCFCLPRRRCFAPAPPHFEEPNIQFPASLYNPRALRNSRVCWSQQYWPSYEDINSRKLGDCRDCFNLTLEQKRWQNNYRGTIPLKEMLALKGKGAIKIGLDAGGGTGTFAAKMAEEGVTIVTTAFNAETLGDKEGGLPYMETIAQRGLIPLHVPHKVRQPFFDNTLDIIHAINTIKYFSLQEFEDLLFEWDRILRPGGIMWFELFYAPVDEMSLYIAVLDVFKYKRLYWNMAPKTDMPEREGAHVYLNCVLEKPRRPNRYEK